MAEMQLNPLQGLIQSFSQNVSNGIKELQGHHKRVFGCGQPKRVIVPPRPAPFAAIIPGDSVGEAVLTTGLLNFLQLYNTALVVRLVLTWFPNPPEFIVSPLATITDPYLGLFRGIIPPLGGTLDLSPILAFVVLNFFTSSAAALPCEADGPARTRRSNNSFSFLQPSKFQQAWERRVQAQRAARDEAKSA